MAMIRSLTRQLAGLAVAQPRVVAAPLVRGAMGLRTFNGVFPSTAAPAAPLLTSSSSSSSLCASAFAQPQVRNMSYKLKSKSAVKKRFRVNANGVVKRAQANKRHIATKKTRERIRRLGKPVLVQGKIRKNILKMLPGRV